MAHGLSAARCGKVRREEAGKPNGKPLARKNGGNALPHLVSNLRQTCGKVRQQEGLCRTLKGPPKGGPWREVRHAPGPVAGVRRP